jgi:hypothetical protein
MDLLDFRAQILKLARLCAVGGNRAKGIVEKFQETKFCLEQAIAIAGAQRRSTYTPASDQNSTLPILSGLDHCHGAAASHKNRPQRGRERP